MQGTDINRHAGSPAAIGIVLIIVGIAALAVRAAGTEVAELVNGVGWPFLVIVPGLAILALTLVTPRPQGLGFAIAGSIVTTVGLILLYQQSTGHWESWAYAWTLITAAAGASMVVYGAVSRRGDLVSVGLRMAAIAGVLFVAGFWFFESIFESGRAPVDLGQWWPVALIALGIVFAVSALLRPPAQPAPLAGDDTPALRGDRT